MERTSSPARILVVDDDADTLNILVRHLQREGFIAIEAPSGAECLRIVSENQVDVILLDVMMPGMDGFEVVAALKSDPRTAEIPIILVTARDDIEARAEGIRLGVAEFLPKPFSRRQLIGRINNQLELLAAGRTTEALLGRISTLDKP